MAAFGVAHDESQDAYLMVYSPWPAFCSELDVRVADTPVGPWTEPIPITLPGCSEDVGGLAGHCYTGTPQLQLCGPEELGAATSTCSPTPDSGSTSPSSSRSSSRRPHPERTPTPQR